MKYIRIYVLLLALTVWAACYSVRAQDTADANGFTSTTSVADKKVDTGMTAIGAVLIGVGVVVLGVGIFYMVKNRRNNLGGIQNQDKTEPTPRTTQSIDNPGSGV
ncbi:MAG: hypothetical protein JSS76_12100 [Bacteroidetes bacterium]|nr:hypothetical protein [Bacteroidota bacterium]MBS1685497.1 hypothetical protein [Bacteroidota bacterium]